MDIRQTPHLCAAAGDLARQKPKHFRHKDFVCEDCAEQNALLAAEDRLGEKPSPNCVAIQQES